MGLWVYASDKKSICQHGCTTTSADANNARNDRPPREDAKRDDRTNKNQTTRNEGSDEMKTEMREMQTAQEEMENGQEETI